MSALVVSTRDALLDVLTRATLTPALTPVAVYDIMYGLKDLQGGRLTIVPQTKLPKLLTRGKVQRQEIKIDVAVQYKYAAPIASELDPYQALAESIIDLFLGTTLSNGAVCIEGAFPHGLFIQEHIKQLRVFTSVVTLGFVLNA
jgi:hypothetical protein